MKTINFIISILSSLWLLGFVASFFGAMFFDAPTAKQDLIIEDFRMFLVAIIDRKRNYENNDYQI